MPWTDFIFSTDRKNRFARHAIFWLMWWLSIFVTDYIYRIPAPASLRNTGYVTLGAFPALKSFLLIVIYALASYVTTYLLLPTILKKQWIKFIAGMITLVFVLIGVSWILYWYIFEFLDVSLHGTSTMKYNTKFWPAINLGLIWPSKIIASVLIIKYIKYWWIKQRESELLEREKLQTALQLLKGQVQPVFLSNSLRHIYDFTRKNDYPFAAELLVKLSDILSYTLYESEGKFMSLEVELERMCDYLELAKIQTDRFIDATLNIKGNITGKKIAPFLMFPLIDYSLRNCVEVEEDAWMNIDIEIIGMSLYVKIASSVLPDIAIHNIHQTEDLHNFRQRLSLLYPDQHELKIGSEQEMLITVLKIEMNEKKVNNHQLSTVLQPVDV